MKQIGRYILTKKLGQGGMGVVYAAKDPLLERQVAIKVLPSHLLGNQTMRQRFMQEAQTVAKLQHPNIVKILDYGEYSPDQLSFQPYFVMEMLGGGSLEDRLRHGNALLLPEVVRILEYLAPAFDTAHSMGIVHRDVKPANILFDRNDIPYLSDFGIARLTATSSITTIGTPDYMAPEQYTAKSGIDGRTDIYQLGVTIYQMVTGRLPFRTETPQQAMYQHLHAAPAPLRQIMPDLPAHWEMVINVALAKQPINRYPTLTELLNALKNPPSLDTAFDIETPENVLTRLDTIYPSSGTIAQYTVPDSPSADRLEMPMVAKKTVLGPPSDVETDDDPLDSPIVAKQTVPDPSADIATNNPPSKIASAAKQTVPKLSTDIAIEQISTHQEPIADDPLPSPPQSLVLESSADDIVTQRRFPIGMLGGIIGIVTLLFVVFFVLRTRDANAPLSSITMTPSEVAISVADTPTATASPPATPPALLTSSAEETVQAQSDTEATQRASIATQSSATTRAEALLSQPACMVDDDFDIVIDAPIYYPEQGTVLTDVDIDVQPVISYTVTIAGSCPVELLNIRMLQGDVMPQWTLLDADANEVTRLEVGETGMIRLTFETLNDVFEIDGEWRLNIANPDNQLLELSNSGQSLKLVASSVDPWLVDTPVVTSQPVATRVIVMPTANPSLSQANQKATADVWNQRLTQTAQAAANAQRVQATQTAQAAAANAQRVQATQTAQAAAANAQRFQATQTAQAAAANAQRFQATQTAQAAAANAQRFQATQTAQAVANAWNATQTAQAVVVPTVTPTSSTADAVCNYGVPYEDADEDGKTNQDEFTDGLDPCNPDTDGDGFIDGQDICPTVAGSDIGCPGDGGGGGDSGSGDNGGGRGD